MRILLALVLFASTPALAQRTIYNDSGGPLRPEQAVFDVHYYDLDLAILPGARTISGTLTMHATATSPTDVILLDLDNPLTVDSVESFARPYPQTLDFERGDGTIRIALGETVQTGHPIKIRVTYHGAPRVAPRPPWDGGFTWSTTADGRPWIAVSCQINGADLWWPTKDHPSDEPDSMRVALTVPAGLRAISNGRYEGRADNGDGTATERWFVSTPINNYGVSFGVAPYEVIEREYTSPLGWSGPVQFFVLPERRADGERQMDGFLDSVAFLERTFGPYAWREDGYKILHTPYLGMEHQSLIAYGSTFDVNPQGFDWLHFHELAHEWWANLGSAADWKDFWIHESFASYSEALYAEDLAQRGMGQPGVTPEEAYRGYMDRSRGRLQNVIPVAPHEPRTTHEMYQLTSGASNGDIYSKGAWVLHTLRSVVNNDRLFKTAMREILYPSQWNEGLTDGRQARALSAIDVQRSFERAAERDLTTVFEAYLHRADIPVLDVSRDASGLVLRWVLGEGLDPAAFAVPVQVQVGPEIRRIEMTGGEGRTPVGPGVDWAVDPFHRTLFERTGLPDAPGR